MKFLKVISSLLVTIVGIFGFIYVSKSLSPEYRDINTTLKGIEDVGNITKDNVIKNKIDGELLFLVMGVDAERIDDDVRNGKRSDTLMLFKVNFDNGNISILSFPRDLRVPVKGKLDKLNHSHAYGGSKLVLQTLRDYTGLDIDYYVKVDYNLVKSVVDSIGGVEVDVPFRMKYDDPTAQPPLHIDFQKGLQRLDGQKAIEYLRWRKNNHNLSQPSDGGDLHRIKTQQDFIKILAKQLLEPKNILSITDLVKSYYENVDTNIELKQIYQGLMVAKDLNINNIQTHVVPGDSKYINHLWYYIADKDKLQEMIDKEYSEYKDHDIWDKPNMD